MEANNNNNRRKMRWKHSNRRLQTLDN